MVKYMVLDMMVMIMMLGYIKELLSPRGQITEIMRMTAMNIRISIMLRLDSIFLRMHMKSTVREEEIVIKINLGATKERTTVEKIDMRENLGLEKDKKRVKIESKTNLGLEKEKKIVKIDMRTNLRSEKDKKRVMMIINREEKISLGKEKEKKKVEVTKRREVKFAMKKKANQRFRELLLLRLLSIKS